MSKKHIDEIARKFFPAGFESLTDHEKQVLRQLADRKHVSRNTNREFTEKLTLGQRLADKMAAFGGSWTFIFIFAAVLLTWVVLNSLILVHSGKFFDPYPYILLNLFLSMLAALQAPVIMMSQNRLAAKDRLDAAHDYEVNLKAELEILALHEKLDALREKQWTELIDIQQKQIDLLTKLLAEKGGKE
ncbi:MAG TPA: hypothetical protein DCQ83_01730 [Fibrobacteres bacterium]|jgi:uncharacterized membrane protein|nr:hypothetical protein [Fibrobacterota bacterium]